MRPATARAKRLVSDYARRHPEWREQIRETFPAVLMLERLSA